MVLGGGLPTTFVPGRNLVFLSVAAAHAYRRDLDTLVGGMCETGYSRYPDCRRATIDAVQQALSLGLDRPVAIETPLMHRTKAETWALAREIGGDALVSLIVEHSHTCYEGVRAELHAWGYGCGACPACDLRAKGYAAGETRLKGRGVSYSVKEMFHTLQGEAARTGPSLPARSADSRTAGRRCHSQRRAHTSARRPRLSRHSGLCEVPPLPSRSPVESRSVLRIR
jgi:hypothetical protein